MNSWCFLPWFQILYVRIPFIGIQLHRRPRTEDPSGRSRTERRAPDMYTSDHAFVVFSEIVSQC